VIEVILPGDSFARAKATAKLWRQLNELPTDKVYRVTVEPRKGTRSSRANAYYWGVVIEAIYQCKHYEPDEIHEYLCGTRWGWKDKKVPKTPRNPSGLESVPVRTTTHGPDGKRSVLSIGDFYEFVEFARRFAAQRLHVVIPDPDPEWFELKRKAA
jgi:hypothetical protein